MSGDEGDGREIGVKGGWNNEWESIINEMGENEFWGNGEEHHSHIISLKEFCQDDDNFYIVEELAEGGELFEAISKRKCYSEREAQNLVRTLLYTLRYCHERHVVHRDLKPENILLKSADDFLNIRIADFGFATHVRGSVRGQR